MFVFFVSFIAGKTNTMIDCNDTIVTLIEWSRWTDGDKSRLGWRQRDLRMATIHAFIHNLRKEDLTEINLKLSFG